MAQISSNRLDELVESLEEISGKPMAETVCNFEEAIRLSTYSGRNDIAIYLISAYLDYFETPVPYEVRFYCEYSSGTRLWRRGNFKEAEAKYESSRDLALQYGDGICASRCIMALGVIRWSRGDYGKALSLLEKAEEGLRERRDLTLSNCLNWLGVICGNLKLYPRSWGYYMEALELNEEKGFSANQGYLLCNLGLLCQEMGLYEQAEESFRKSMDLQKQVGNRYGYTDSLSNLAMLIHKYHERSEEALPKLREAAEMQLENGEKAKAGLVYTNAAVAAFESGETDEAMILFDRAEELVFSTEIWDTQVEFCGMKAEILTAMDDYDGAEELFVKGNGIIARNLPGRDDENLLRVQSELYRKKGDYREAYETLVKSVKAAENIGRVRAAALQSVIQAVSDSARKNRELQEAKYRASLLEERNRALTASEERFRNLVQAMAGIGVMAVDGSGKITFWNRTCENLYGYRATEALGKSVKSLLVPAHLQPWFSSLLEGELSGGEFEINLLAADGKLKDLLVSTVRLFPGETFLIQVDHTEQRRAENQRILMEAQMRRTQKLEALGTLAGGIAHDFNNLLQGILGNASILCETSEEGSEQFRSAELIRNAAERSSELCVQMLDYAGVEPVGNEILDMNDIVTDMLPLLRTSFPENVELVLELAPDIPPVEGDRSQLRQVLMNLALNGAESIRSAGKVTISTRCDRMAREDFSENLIEEAPSEGEYICVTVRDQGEGIEQRTLSRIFDPFFSTKRTGRGLGLAAVLGIIRGHAGAITVDSIPGRGSEFNVYLKKASAGLPEHSQDEMRRGDSSFAGRKILVVDDEEIVRDTVSSILRASGCACVTFNGGAEVLEYLGGGAAADLLILDLTMPGMSGLDVFRSISEMESDIPVLIISGYSREKLSTVFGNRSPAGLLQKPFRPEELRDKLSTILSRN